MVRNAIKRGDFYSRTYPPNYVFSIRAFSEDRQLIWEYEMGGMGSGRYAGRLLCESLPSIDVRQWKRDGDLVPNRRFSLRWSSANLYAAVLVGHNEVQLTFDGTSRWVPLGNTRCNFGGERVWFNCPNCMAHVAILFYRSERFACRVCQRLAYRTENLDRLQRVWAAQARLERRLGDDLGRPKGMHQTTYRTLLARHRAIVEARYRMCVL